MKKNLILLVCILLFLPAYTNSYQEENPQQYKATLNLDYRTLQPGEVIRVILKGSSAIKFPQIRFLNKKYTMGRGKNLDEWLTFIGLDLGIKPGNYPLKASVLYKDGYLEHLQKELMILEKKFPVKKLWVQEKFVTPPPEALDRIRWESELLRTVYDIYTPQWLGDGNFIIPSVGKVSPNFGEKRVYNNKPRSSHSGVDVSSPFGAPVKASNSGKVVMASDLYYSGKTVIIDHGLGVFSIYLHFSKIKVSIGDFVKKGDIIGNIGATGRVTGPHLHWGFKILRDRVDPFSLLSIKFE